MTCMTLGIFWVGQQTQLNYLTPCIGGERAVAERGQALNSFGRLWPGFGRRSGYTKCSYQVSVLE